jgi:sec-independent protein translocase protein TatC
MTASLPEPEPMEARERELESSRMPFLQHLGELRIRLRNAIIALVAAFLVAYAFKETLLALLLRPLSTLLAELATKNPDIYKQSLFFGSITAPMWVYLSLSLWAGVFLASPFIFHQLWLFIAPGLYKNERRYGIGFAIASAILFISGAAFCYAFVLEPTHAFLLSFATENLGTISEGLGAGTTLSKPIALVPLLTVDEYLGFAEAFLLGFGLIFELPLVLFFLSLTGAITHRDLWKFNRYAIVLAFVIGAVLTPSTDWLSQTLMAAPIIVMYYISIVLSYFVTMRRERHSISESGTSSS